MIFQDFVDSSEMGDCWRLLHPDERRFTRYGTNQHGTSVAARLDYFFASSLLLNYLDTASIGIRSQSDHAPIFVTFILDRNPRGPGLFRFPDFLLQNDEYAQVLQETVTDILKCSRDLVPPNDCPSPALLWDTVKCAIRGHTLEFLGTHGKQNREYLSLRQKIVNTQIEIDYFLASGYDVDLQCELLENKRLVFEQLGEKVDLKKKTQNITQSQVFGNTCCKYFFKKVKGIPGAIRHLFSDIDHLVTTDYEILEICEEFYTNLYAHCNQPHCKLDNFSYLPEYLLSDIQRNEMALDITQEELGLALKAMKRVNLQVLMDSRLGSTRNFGQFWVIWFTMPYYMPMKLVLLRSRSAEVSSSCYLKRTKIPDMLKIFDLLPY